MNTLERQTWLLLALVVIDLAIKMVMFRVLPAGRPIHECFVCLVLRINPLNLGSHAQAIVAYYGMEVLIESGIFSIVLAATLLALTITSRLTKRSVVLSIVGAFTCALTLAALLSSFGELPVSMVATATRFAQAILWLTIWALATSPLWKTGALLYAATGLANSLSAIFPPYQVIDYLWSSPLHRAIGMGVFNFADILGLIAPIVLTIALIVSVLGWLARLGMRKGRPA